MTHGILKNLIAISISSVTYSTCLLLLFSCQANNQPKLSPGHLTSKTVKPQLIPKTVEHTPRVPLPSIQAKVETYTVVVSDVPVKELLYSLARDAKINVDIHPKISGKVTINAYKQTLANILQRVSKQVNLRYQFKNKNLTISPDTPYWKTYRIDYVNMIRKASSEVSVATQIATTGGSVKSSGGGGSSQGNISKTKVTNVSNNDFWKTILANLKTIVGERKNNNTKSNTSLVVSNPISGIINIKATQNQHLEAQVFIEKVMSNAQRQVLIEMTIVEVELSDRFQAGIDWQRLSKLSGVGSNGLSIKSKLIGANLTTAPFFSLGYNQTLSNGSNISATLKLLETFGNVKVLSSPKLMTLNNQTALLKVVDEKVYFTVALEVQVATANSPETKTYTSDIHTVPVGLVMSVIPQINKEGYVSLNVRPTITRITGFANDPAPALMNADFTNLIPEIQVRELESLLQVADGHTVVMGGLMQNRIDKKTKEIPGFKRFKKLNKFLSYRDNNFTKTELVIFLKPTIVKDARMPASTNYLKRYLPTDINQLIKTHPPAAGF